MASLLTIMSSCAVSIGTDSEVAADAFLNKFKLILRCQLDITHHYDSPRSKERYIVSNSSNFVTRRRRHAGWLRDSDLLNFIDSSLKHHSLQLRILQWCTSLSGRCLSKQGQDSPENKALLLMLFDASSCSLITWPRPTFVVISCDSVNHVYKF